MKLKDSYFYKTINVLKSTPANLFYILFFDVLFFLSLAAYLSLSGIFISKFLIQAASAALFLILSLAHYLILIILYSIFKYYVLGFTKSFFAKVVFNFSRFWKFYFLNIILALTGFIIFILLNVLLTVNTKQQYAPFVFIFVLILYLFFYYPFFNSTQTFFSYGSGLKKSLKNGLSFAFKGARYYAAIFLNSILFLVIVFSLYYLILKIIEKLFFKGVYPNIYVYNNFFIWFTAVVFYIVVFFNRFTFFLILKEKFLKK